MLTPSNIAGWIEALAVTPGVLQVCLGRIDGARIAPLTVYPARAKVSNPPSLPEHPILTLEGEWLLGEITENVASTINALRQSQNLPPLNCKIETLGGRLNRAGRWAGALQAGDFSDNPTGEA